MHHRHCDDLEGSLAYIGFLKCYRQVLWVCGESGLIRHSSSLEYLLVSIDNDRLYLIVNV